MARKKRTYVCRIALEFEVTATTTDKAMEEANRVSDALAGSQLEDATITARSGVALALKSLEEK